MDALTIAGSALTAQSTNLNVIAGNAANATTPGYTAKQAFFAPMNPGVSVAAVIDTGQSVDLGTAMVNLITARSAYQAALKVVSTANQMTDALLAAV
jgi:flagellar hook protein FlgE